MAAPNTAPILWASWRAGRWRRRGEVCPSIDRASGRGLGALPRPAKRGEVKKRFTGGVNNGVGRLIYALPWSGGVLNGRRRTTKNGDIERRMAHPSSQSAASRALPTSIDATFALLSEADYLADRSLAT